jgi:linoleoyl-CoA desaturase
MLGGLNFQIEHHLLSRICHVHYPALSKIVEELCHEFGIRYAAHRTFWRWKKRGRSYVEETGTELYFN